MTITIKSDVDVDGYVKMLGGDEMGEFVATEWRKLIEPYVPYLTGMLAGSAQVTPWQIEYTTPYAAYQYYGDGFTFTTSYHPLAGSRWDERAQSTQLPALAKSIESYIKQKL